jgi:hypothetical protein
MITLPRTPSWSHPSNNRNPVPSFSPLEFLYDVLREWRRRFVAPLRADEVADAVVDAARSIPESNVGLRRAVDHGLEAWESPLKSGKVGSAE